MRILVTGSLGFIGSYLMSALRGKHKILGVDKKYGVDIVEANHFFNTVNYSLGKPDFIVHLAAQTSRKQSIANPDQVFLDNVVGTFNVCRLARQTGARLIFASSRYAEANKEGKQDPYGLSKYVGELYVKNYGENYNVEFIIDRIGNVYGPGQEGSQEAFWLPWFIKASQEKLPITIYGFGGKQSRCMLYIDDLVALLLDQIENFGKYKGNLYEVGGGLENEISLLEALRILNYDNYTFGPELPGDSKRLVYNNKEVSAVNGWKPMVSIEEGLKKTLGAK
jgi:CDP-paratose 2-epimerase